jgi:hypothetical protein
MKNKAKGLPLPVEPLSGTIVPISAEAVVASSTAEEIPATIPIPI